MLGAHWHVLANDVWQYRYLEMVRSGTPHPERRVDMDLLLRKTGGLFAFLAKDYELLHNGSVCCTLSFYDWKHVEFLIDGNRYIIRSDGKARWVLEQSRHKVAFCERHASAPQLEFSVNFDDRTWCFKPHRKRLVVVHDVWEEKRQIGQITPHIGFWWPKVGATFKQTPRPEVAVFAVWLIGIHWVGVAGKLTAARAAMGM